MTEEEYNKLVEEVGRSEANRQRRAAERGAKRKTREARRKARGDYNEATTGSRIRSNGKDLNNPLGNDFLMDAMQEMYRLQGEADEARYRRSNIKPDFGSGGLDYLAKNYNPAANPYDRRSPNYIDPQARAASAVAEAKELQRARAEQRQMDLERYGTTTDGEITNYYSNPLSPSEGPDFTVINIPEQYGGGMAYGGSENLIKIDPNRELPTGSGIPMSALEAFSTDKLENNIYAPEDRSSPSSMDANDARRFMVQESIKDRIKDFYETPRELRPVLEPEPVLNVMEPMEPMETPVVGEVFPPAPALIPKPVTREKLFQPAADYMEDAGPLLDNPISRDALDTPEVFLGALAGINDLFNSYIANPLMYLFTGKEQFTGDETKDAVFNLFNPRVD
jgi:hypothetical protein